MRTLILLDATGSMAGDPIAKCIAHARREFPPSTPVLMDGAATLKRTTLERADIAHEYYGGPLINAKLIRETLMAMPTGRVVFYTDGYIRDDATVGVPPGRLEVRLVAEDAVVRKIMNKVLPGCDVVTI